MGVEPDKKPAGAVETQTETGPKKPEQQQNVPAAAVVRGQWGDFLDEQGKKILDQKAAKEAELAALKQKSGQTLKPEAWRSKPEKSFLTAGFAKGQIETLVDTEARTNPQILNFISKLGLNAQAVDAIKRAAKEFTYEYYIRCDSEFSAKEDTENYVRTQLLDKLTFAFNELNRIYESKNFPFKTPMECVEKFSNFPNPPLGIIQNGLVNSDGLKNFLCGDKQGYAELLTAYNQSLALELDVKDLNGKAANLVGEKIDDMGKLFSDGLITLKSNPKVTIPANPADLDKAVTDAMNASFLDDPNNPVLAIRTKCIKWALEKLKAANPTPGKQYELAPKAANWKEAVIAPTPNPTTAPGQNPAANPAGAPGQTPTGSPTAAPAAAQNLDDFESPDQKGIWGTIIMMFAKFSPTIKDLLLQIKFIVPKEFSGLTIEQRNDGLALKEAATQLGLDQETLSALYRDKATMLKLFQYRDEHEKGLPWKEYLEIYLDDAEKQALTNPISSTESTKILEKLTSVTNKPRASMPQPVVSQSPAANPQATQAAPANKPKNTPYEQLSETGKKRYDESARFRSTAPELKGYTCKNEGITKEMTDAAVQALKATRDANNFTLSSAGIKKAYANGEEILLVPAIHRNHDDPNGTNAIEVWRKATA